MIKRSLVGKAWPAMLFYLGTGILDIFYISIVMFGFSFIEDNMALKIIIGIFGIGYLLYIGLENIKDFLNKGFLAQGGDLSKKKTVHPFFEGMFVNLANPVAIASWAAFCGVVPAEFSESIVLNIATVMFGAYSVGIVIILIGFSVVFAYNLVSLF